MTFVPVYAARCLHVRKFEFYPIYIRYFASTAVAAVACWGIRSIFGLIADNWISLILTCCLYALVTLCVDMCLLLGQKERSLLSDMVKRKLHIA